MENDGNKKDCYLEQNHHLYSQESTQEVQESVSWRKVIYLSKLYKKIKNFQYIIDAEIIGNRLATYGEYTELNALTFKKMIMKSVDQLRKYQNAVNSINVFPVKDGDTGTNMLNTMIGVKNSLEGLSENSFKTISQELIKAILLSARGNSGTILAEYFTGFMLEIKDVHVLTGNHLIRALKGGANSAWKALEQPIKGTILDVFSAAAEGADIAHKKTNDIGKILDGALKNARSALKNTQFILPQMQRARVVDAGGAGFLFMLDGFRTGINDESPKISEEFISKPLKVREEKLSFQYCAEAVLRDVGGPIEELRQKIEDFGNSLHLVGDTDLLKLHIHTNIPNLVKEICQDKGQIVDWKVDDIQEMQKDYLNSLQEPLVYGDILRENRSKNITRNRIAVVTDSSSDIPGKWLKRYPIFIVNTPVILANDPTDLSEKNTLREFYNKMTIEKNFVPITSQPNAKHFTDAYVKALEVADTVFCIPISSCLSGAYKNAVQAKNKIGNDNIYIIDSHSASLGVAMLVHRVFDLQEAGKDHLDILTELYAIRDRMEQYFIVDKVKYLCRGGRFTRRSILGQILHAHPLLQLKEGDILDTGRRIYSTDPEKQVFMLAREIEEFISEREPLFIFIVHSNAEAKALKLKECLEKMNLSKGTIKIAEFGMVIGAHLGPGTLAIYYA